MPPETQAATPAAMGRVKLVGAGPGAADLLTLRAARAIETADALLYDALVSEEILALAPARCLRIQTGKRAGRASMNQDTINRLMLRLAGRGLTVVRLKGGDPSVFGRVGEEKAFLAAHGVPVEITPGVTAASAAAAQFGVPLSHRGEARRILFLTAATRDGALPETGWAAAADPQTTLAIYMGKGQAAAIAEKLVANGCSPRMPVLAVENAGRPETRAFAAEVATLAQTLANADPTGPLVILVGAVTTQACLAPAPEDVANSGLKRALP